MATEKRRRQHGTGSVHQRESDRRWIGSIEAGWTARGTRRRITVSAACTCRGDCRGPGKCAGEAEARRRLRDKQRTISAEGLPSVDARGGTTVKQWADTWLPQHVARVRHNTARTDSGAVTRWIVPTIGTRRLETLTPGDVRAVHTAILSAGLTTTTARHSHSVLTKMLKAAILEGHAVPQRVLLVKAPPVATNDRDAIPLDAALQILDAAAEQPDRARWVAALLQGMRQGECLGLTWDRVDLERGVIDVTWQLDTLPYADRAAGTFRVAPDQRARRLVGAWHLTDVKSKSGNRVVPIVPWMRAALDQWRRQAPASPHGLVWPREDGRPRDEKADRAAWADLQAVAGVAHPSGRPYTLHEARHTTATLLLEGGVDPEVIKAVLGHSSIVTSRGYQHVSQELARRALDGVAQRLGLTAGPAPAAALAQHPISTS